MCFSLENTHFKQEMVIFLEKKLYLKLQVFFDRVSFHRNFTFFSKNNHFRPENCNFSSGNYLLQLRNSYLSTYTRISNQHIAIFFEKLHLLKEKWLFFLRTTFNFTYRITLFFLKMPFFYQMMPFFSRKIIMDMYPKMW